jgi:hypothetical protein
VNEVVVSAVVRYVVLWAGLTLTVTLVVAATTMLVYRSLAPAFLSLQVYQQRSAMSEPRPHAVFQRWTLVGLVYEITHRRKITTQMQFLSLLKR